MRKWLVEARKAKGMTQLEVATAIGITESYYSYIENGERQKRMDIALAAKLSVIFDIPIDRIIEFERGDA